MPTVTYTGSLYTKACRVPGLPDWQRGRPVEMSQELLNEWRHTLKGSFVIKGDEGVHADLGADGIPDSAWTKAKITEWLTGQGVHVGGGFKTKMTLLDMVEGVLNPAPVAEPVVEEAPVEEPAEEVVETETETIGDDE